MARKPDQGERNLSVESRAALQDAKEQMRGFLGMEAEELDDFLDLMLDENGKVRPEAESLHHGFKDFMQKHEDFLTNYALPGGGMAKGWALIRNLLQLDKSKK